MPPLTSPTAHELSEDTPLLEAIAASMGRLRRSERKVAQIVLTSPREAIHLTMAGLAELAGVSEPTVMRFCTAMGCSGFQDFKLALAQTVALGLPIADAAIEPGDELPGLVVKVFDQSIRCLDRARRGLENSKELEEAVKVLSEATEILFIGFGASSIVAQDAQQKFPLFGVPCSAPVDAHQQLMAAAMSGPRTAVVGISNTGRSKAVIDILDTAKERGATTIGISGDRGALLAMSDVPLLVRTYEDTDYYTPTVSRLAALAVIDILATGVALRRSPEHLAQLREMKELLSVMRSGGQPQPATRRSGNPADPLDPNTPES